MVSLVFFKGVFLCSVAWTVPDGFYQTMDSIQVKELSWDRILLACRECGITGVGEIFQKLKPELVEKCWYDKNYEKLLKNPSCEEIFADAPPEKDVKAREIFPNNFFYLQDYPDYPYIQFPYSDDIEYLYDCSERGSFLRLPEVNFPWLPLEADFDTESGKTDDVPNYYKLMDETHLRQRIAACEFAVTQIDQTDPFNWWNLGVAQEASGFFLDAINSYHRAANLTPNVPRIWAILANAYFLNGELDQARLSATKAMNLYDQCTGELKTKKLAINKLLKKL